MPLAPLVEPFNEITIEDDGNGSVSAVEYASENQSTSASVIDVDVSKIAQYKTSVSTKDFELLRVIGQGSFGRVFLVKKNSGQDAGNFYAMKVLKKAVLKVRDRVRTKMERDILVNISHPFIVNLFYAFQTEGKVYLILEFLRGGDLFTRLVKEIMFTEDDVRFYLSELALALDYLHSIGIIYRDLKPENVLLNEEGHIRLTDFGLCKEAIFSNDLGNEKAYSFCGTVEYMAPEIIKRSGHCKAADWWSYAVLMYEMLTGFLPFQGSTRKETMNLILKSKLAMPQFLSPEAQSLLRALFKRTPANRLGYGPEGFEKLKSQPFFTNTNWDDLLTQKVTPPFKPRCTRIDDVFNFDKEFTAVTPKDSPSPLNIPFNNDIFKGFSYIAPRVKNDLTNNTKENMTLSPDDANSTDEDRTKPGESVGKLFTRILGVKTREFSVDYKLLEEIGQGAFSRVHKCLNLSDNCIYAVKILNTLQRDPQEEVEILMRFNAHPHIVSLENVYENGDNVYIVMTYLAGGELLDEIYKKKSFSERDANRIMNTLISTIDYLHKNLIVHRDLKPSNIMFLKSGCDFLDIRICDFGFAKQLRAENGLLMTPCYTTNFVAPEVLKMQGYQTACDVWSLGIILYVILSGKTPFMMRENTSPKSILKQIEINQVAFSGPEWADISPNAIELIEKMLNIEPKKRITIKEIKEHPWILESDKLSNEPLVELQRNLNDSYRPSLKKILKETFGQFDNTQRHRLEPVHVSKIAQRRSKLQHRISNLASAKLNLPPII